MTPLILINSLAVLLVYLSQYYNKTKYLYWGALVMLCVFYGCRYDFGNDYWNYYNMFNNIGTNHDYDSNEPGWILLNHLCQPIGFFGMIIVLTVFEYSTIFYFIRKYIIPQYRWFAVFIFCFNFNFLWLGCSMMRQFLAMVILLYAIEPIAKRNLIYFFIIVGIAVSIHQTSVVFILTYIFAYWKPKINKPIFIIGFICAFIALMVVSKTYISLFEIGYKLFQEDRFYDYLSWDQGNYTYTLAFDLLWLVLLMYYFPQNQYRKVICLISIVSYILLPFTYVLVLLSRLMLFFGIFYIFSVPTMFASIKQKPVRISLMLAYSILMVKRSMDSLNGGTYGECYIYDSIFNAGGWM